MNNRSGLGRFTFLTLVLATTASSGHADTMAPPATVAWQWLDDECEGACKLRVSLVAGPNWSGADTAWIAFNQSEEGGHYVAEIAGKEARFLKVHEGVATPFGQGHPLAALTPGATLSVTLRREPWQMVLIVGDEVVAQAQDCEYRGGRVALATTGPGLAFEAPQFQPLAPLFFSDDFMRGEGDAGAWGALVGEWRVGSPQEGTRADPRLSANPFFYRVKSLDRRRAVAVAGDWFWDRYAVSAAIRLPETGAAGLCAFVQDETRYVAFRVADRAGKPVAELAQVSPTQEVILAERPVDCRLGQWYRLALEARFDGLRGSIDGAPVCATDAVPFGQGKIGLCYEGEQPPATLQFDDVRVRSARELAVAELSTLPWTEVSGDHAQVPAPLQVTGSPDWREYRASLEVSSGTEDDVGLCFGYLAPDDFYLLRRHTSAWSGETSWQLWKADPGGASQLASEPEEEGGSAETSGNGWVAVSVEISAGFVCARVGATTTLAAVDEALMTGARPPGGQVGILAAGAPSDRYRNLVVSFRDDVATPLEVTQQFAQEDTMSQWASPAGAWRLGEGGWIWRRDEFFRDCEFGFPLPDQVGAGEIRTVLAGDGKDPRHGYCLKVNLNGRKPLACGLLRDEKPVASHDGMEWEPGDTLSVQRDGELVRVLLADRVVLGYCDSDPLAGTKVGFRTAGIPTDLDKLKKPRYGTTKQNPVEHRQARNGFLNALGNLILHEVLKQKAPAVHQILRHMNVNVDFVKILSKRQREEDRLKKAADPKLELAELSARSSRLYDCNFSSAPADWRATDGEWQITQRWTCSPQWTFFGGRGGKRPTLWSKREFQGDQVVEFYAAKPMAVQGNGNDHPHNLSLTMCGDGNDPNSGYVFTVAGDDGKTNRLLRNGVELGAGPYRLSSNDPHRSWLNIRAERIGRQLRLSVDDEVLFEREDPAPLPGGPLAFWSDPQGMMVARVKVWDSGPQP